MDTDCRKSLFFPKSACSQSLTPNPFPVAKGCVCLVGSASCRAFGHTRPASVPGLSVGLPPLVQARMLVVSHTKPLHDAVAQMADDLYGGYAPKQGRFGCLPKVLHDAKPTKQATLDTPFSINKRFIEKLKSTARKQWIFFIFGFSKLPNSESALSNCLRR